MGVPMHIHTCSLEGITVCLPLALSSIYFETLTEPAAHCFQWTTWPASPRIRPSPCHTPGLQMHSAALSFNVGAGVWTQDFMLCTASTVYTEPSPQPVLQPETNGQKIKYKNSVINFIFNHPSKCK